MKEKRYKAGIGACAIVLLISVIMIAGHYISASQSEKEFDGLVEIVENSEKLDSMQYDGDENVQSPLAKYQELYQMNNDMIGWISIEGTNINYPVMYTPDNKDYYLKHNFEKGYSSYGVPYIAEHCNPLEPSDNVIIYGHHMKNGSMFSDLMKYESEEFYNTQNTINFDSLTETAEYEIFAVFKTTVYDDAGFKYYQFVDAELEQEFTEYVQKCKELSLYDTGISAEYGDKLITLSTCEYSRTNGRMVIVAKKIVEQ